MDALRSDLAAGRTPASGQPLAAYVSGWLDAEHAHVEAIRAPEDMRLPDMPDPATGRER
jgi:hypothetical protein